MGFVKYPTEDIRLYIEDNFDNEKQIALYHKTKNKELRNRIVQNNLLLVLNVAKEYQYPTKTPLGDLIADGTIALIKAVEKYDPKEGVLFSTYATNSIKNEISGSVNEWYGEGNKYYGEAIKKYRSKAIAIFGEERIYNEDIMDYVLGIMLEEDLVRPGTIPEVKSRLLSESLYDVEYFPEDENKDDRVVFTTKEEALDIPYEEEDFDRISFIKKYKDYFYSGLTDYEKEVMDYYCGFKDGKAYTQPEIAKIFGISHQAISQQVIKAVTKMKRKAERHI